MQLTPFIQVINLDRDTIRMQNISSTLLDFDLAFQRLSAVDGASVPTPENVRAKRLIGRHLYAGEIGCYLSHLNAIDNFLASDAEYGLVLEDDAVPSFGASDRLSEVLQVLSKISVWDVVNLGRPPKKEHTPVGIEYCSPEIGLCHAHYPPITTTALLWSRGGARTFRLLNSQPNVPIDVALQTWGAKTDRILALRQPIFAAADGESTIKSSNRHSGGGGLYSLFARLRRISLNKSRAKHNRKRRRAS